MILRRCTWSLLVLLLLLAFAFSVPAAETTVGSVALTDAERQWLKAHPVITLAPDPDFKPIEYFDKNGTYQGAAADIIRILEKKLGITITVVHLQNWDEGMEKFKKQEVDLLGAMVRTPDREKFALFTETLVTVPGAIFARSGTQTNLTLKGLKGKKVAVVSNYAAHDIIKNQYPEITLEVVADVSTGLAKASLGMVDVYVENMANATFYSQEAGITNLQVAGKTEFDYRWGIGVRKDWPELQGILNKGLAAISEEERAQAIKRWISIEGQRWQPTRTFIVGSVAVSLATILVLVIYWNYSLHKVVRNRTATLQQELEERLKAENALKNLTGQLEERVRERTAELQEEIGERQQAEDDLMASERRFKSLIRNSSDSITILDKDGIQIYVSDVVERMLGYKPSELINIPVMAEMIHPDDQEATQAAFLKILQEGEGGVQYRHRHKNGSWVYLEAWGTNQLENPDIRGVVVNVRDITDRKYAEEALHQNEVTFRKLFAESSDAILLIDETGVFVECNQAALDLLKMTREQFLLLPPARISPEFQPDGRRSAEAAPEMIALAYSKGLHRFDWTCVNAEGSEFIVEVSLMPITLRGQTMLHTAWRDITERKRAEKVLQFSEKKFATIFNLMPDMVGITRMADGCFIEVNDGFERWTGWTREEALGKSSLDLGVWDHNARAEAVAILQEQGHLEEYEFTMRTKSGELRSALMYLLPLIVQDEKCLFFLARDVTERKWAEEAVLREKEFFAEAMNSLPGVFYIISPTDKFLHWNENYETVAEYSAEEFGRISPLELFTGTDKDLIRERILETFAKGASSAEAELVSKNGRRIPYHFTGRTITIDGLTCLIGMGVDITVSREREALLKLSEERFRSIIENMQDVYYRADAEGRLSMISPSGVRLFGYDSKDDMLGKVVRETFYHDPNERDVFIQNLKIKGYLYNHEVTLRSKDGKPIPVATSTHLIFAADGSFIGVEGVFRDVSAMKSAAEERLQLERQLLHAQKLESLGVLSGGIAHDFNNILTAIIGNAEMALMRLNPESPALDNLQRIEKAAARAADLARQMLAYSGKGKFVVEHIDLNRLVEEMGHMLEVSISKKAVLRYNLTKPLPAVNVDATQIRQIIMNLVINASEAIGDRSGILAITTGCLECDQAYLKDVWLSDPIPEGLYVFLEVADSGCGMDKETLARIFDPFFTTKFTGRGLGMAAVLGIIRGHNGAIKVYSEPGKGSSFKVLLPAGEKPAALFNGETVTDSWRGSGTALLVDDEETVRAIGAEMLRELGYATITATDGLDALEKFKSGDDISVVILDLTMPHMDGEQCFRELRMLDPGVKVIICSGFSEHEVTQKFEGKGLAGFIQKPYTLSVLKEAVKKSMGS